MKTPTQKINIESASVRVMRSYDYSHFEVCLTSSSATTPQGVDELRKAAQRLADHAVEQFKTAKSSAERRETMKQEWLLKQAEDTPETERTPEAKAIIKYHADAAFASQFDYDYEDDYEQP
jgi:hypothetical protein